MLFSYGYGWQQNQRFQKMQANQWQFWSPSRQGNTAQCASPNGAHLWLHAKPLDAAIGQVPAPYCPGSRHGQRFRMKHKNTNNTQLLPSFLTVDQRKKAKQFWDPKWTLYSCHWCNKLHRNVKLLFELKSSATFWAIKLSQRTKIRKVISLERSQKKPAGHIWPYSN